MKDMNDFESAARLAKLDAPPSVDVSVRVRRTIHQPAVADDPVIWIIGAVASAAAAVAALPMMLDLWQMVTDPLVAAFSVASGASI